MTSRNRFSCSRATKNALLQTISSARPWIAGGWMRKAAAVRAAAERSWALSTMRRIMKSRTSCAARCSICRRTKEGPSCGRRVDLRRASTNAVRVLAQVRVENILITKDLDAPFARSVDAVERLPQRVAMHCQRCCHAVVAKNTAPKRNGSTVRSRTTPCRTR